jgi:hypothetical protein
MDTLLPDVEPLWPDLDQPEVPYTFTLDLVLPPDADAEYLEAFVARVRAFEQRAALEQSLIVITPVARAEVTVQGRSGPLAMQSVLAAIAAIADGWFRVEEVRGSPAALPART